MPVFDAKLDDLLPKPSKKIKDGIQSAQLILITSQEIDELGEADNMAQARLQIDGVLSHLRRGVRGGLIVCRGLSRARHRARALHSICSSGSKHSFRCNFQRDSKWDVMLTRMLVWISITRYCVTNADGTSSVTMNGT